MILIFLQSHYITRNLLHIHLFFVKVLLPWYFSRLGLLSADEKHLSFSEFKHFLIHSFQHFLNSFFFACFFNMFFQIFNEDLHINLDIDIFKLFLIYHSIQLVTVEIRFPVEVFFAFKGIQYIFFLFLLLFVND